MFKKYSCGCIVLVIGAIYIMIDPCDKDEFNRQSGTFMIMNNTSRLNDLKAKEWDTLPIIEQEKYLQQISINFYDGYKFQEIQLLLGGK